MKLSEAYQAVLSQLLLPGGKRRKGIIKKKLMVTAPKKNQVEKLMTKLSGEKVKGGKRVKKKDSPIKDATDPIEDIALKINRKLEKATRTITGGERSSRIV